MAIGKNKKIQVLDLCSGIGGFSLGLERAGMETIAFCESDLFCQKVLKKHWPHIPIFADVKKLQGEDVESTVDLICAGYPCQPFSVAGHQRGIQDDRYLWPEIFRIVRNIRPRWTIFENVAGHIKMGLDSTLSDLESSRYETQSFLIPACAVDAPHRRDRVWIVAHAKGIHDRANIPDEMYRQIPESGDGHLQTDVPHLGGIGLQSGDAISWRPGGDEKNEKNKWEKSRRNVRWAPEPSVARVVHGLPGRVDRVKGLGNAVVPQIVEIIGRAIMAVDGYTRD